MNKKATDITLLHGDGQAHITLVTQYTPSLRDEVADLKAILAKGKELTFEIKQHRQKRSMDANSYMWIICQKIAEYMKFTKEYVYQKAVRDVGQFQIVPIKNEAVDRWIEIWNSKGLGWFAEVLDDSKLTGYKKVISYYGSSVYDTKEMSVLIDCIVEDAKALGIETMTKTELELLKSSWNKQ